ncbi:MAG: valine--tRNA ligase [Saprospiraceae bacterium]|nr:valine--tRNA ligase [Saprospiraceae bacterium]
MEVHYNPAETEIRIYGRWLEKGHFRSTPDDRPPYTIVMPPPNVTGVLHMGHMLNNTIQDILIRRARQTGYNACWVPGTDHASIATEAKVVQMLRQQGIRKSDLSREQFLEHAWKWKEKYGGIILDQLRRLGASCDWERTAFTMDPVRSQAVIRAFVDLYRRGKLYRGQRMIQWDPEAQTVLSNEEVLYQSEQARLYHICYRWADGQPGGIVIATQRPETIMADTAVCVHPNDPRYAGLVGREVLIPLIEKAIPVIADEYIDPDFGTGALKVTPAHDPNDYELGQRHGLDVVDCLTADGRISEVAGILVGMDRFEAREAIRPMLEAAGVLVKTEDYTTNIGRSERTRAVVEPRLSLQWFVHMKDLAAPALEAVENDSVRFIPSHFKNTYRHWMENIRDWCISRQLWWGHRIPAWYLDDEVYVAETVEEALALARNKTGRQDLIASDLRQEEDVLDTWFSSWLWPMSVFGGDDGADLRYYFPTNTLVTGWDIIFLWVARMVMASYEWHGQAPFAQVYFTGMVRDQQRRKMSKSLGNSPDALKLIDDYGADGVRFGILASAPAGGDLLFDEKLCAQGRNFSNKLWNALRLVRSWKDQTTLTEPNAGDALLMRWLEQRLNGIAAELEQDFSQFRLSEAIKLLYSFVWDDYCSFFLEAAKPRSGQAIPAKLADSAQSGFLQICSLLHPFMPFVTEEIWQQLCDAEAVEDCMVTPCPSGGPVDEVLQAQVVELREVIRKVRELRARHRIRREESLPLYVLRRVSHPTLEQCDGAAALLERTCGVTWLGLVDEEPAGAQAFLGLRDSYYLQLPVTVDTAAERLRLEEEIRYAEGFVQSVRAKLENPRFAQSAPADVVEREQRKLQDGLSRLQALKEQLGDR